MRSRAFDLLVSDVNLPEMSGVDLTEKVRWDRLLRRVPIILVTSLDSLEDQAHAPTSEPMLTSPRAPSTTSG